MQHKNSAHELSQGNRLIQDTQQLFQQKVIEVLDSNQKKTEAQITKTVSKKMEELKRHVAAVGEGAANSRPQWCIDSKLPFDWNPPYYLVSHVYVRIYKQDKAELSVNDVLHWLTFMKYAGTQHVYLYDCYRTQDEKLEAVLKPAIQAGFVTYIDWHQQEMEAAAVDNHIDKAEVPARLHCQEKYGKDYRWITHVDIDEYPFAPNNVQPGFLRKFIEKQQEQDLKGEEEHGVVEYTLANYLMLGYRFKEKGQMLIQQVTRRTKDPGNQLVKPIVLGGAVQLPMPHHNSLKYGKSKNINDDVMRMNHYWGARLQHWRPEMPEDLVQKTEEDKSILPIADKVMQCFL